MSEIHPTDIAGSENETSPIDLAGMRARLQKIWLSPRDVLKLREQYAEDVAACLREIGRLRDCLRQATQDAPRLPPRAAAREKPGTKPSYLSVKQVQQRLN